MKRRTILKGALSVAPLLIMDKRGLAQNETPSPKTDEPALLEGNTRAHDPSTIVRDGDKFWIFHTGRSGPSKFSSDLKAWQQGPPVFGQLPIWWSETVPENRGDWWAPDVIKIGSAENRRWAIFYSVSSFGKNTSAIGLVTNATLNPDAKNFAWRDEGIVVQSRSEDNFNTIDPSVTFDKENRLWLSFGSFWSGIKLVELNSKTGKRLNTEIFSIAAAPPGANDIEAPCLYRHGDEYFLFVNRGFCCRGAESTYEVRIGRSKNIIGPYLDKEGRDLIKGGGSPFLARRGHFIGPGHIGILENNGALRCSYHFYDEANRGRPTLMIQKLTFDAEGWPQIAL